ncbi:hypothetical protein EDC04DRAFT_474657 [Pisolithus marmoratus]|nr:hypothetical protein EDC04DRAFT_474657 [Pisolithus marmoratus]
MVIFQRFVSSLDQLLGSSTRQQESHYRSPPGRKSSAASFPNDTAQSATPLPTPPTHHSVQRPPEEAESGTSPSGVRSQGSVSGSRSTVDKTQSMEKQSASGTPGRNFVPDTNTERLPSAPLIAPGNSISTSLTDSLPQASPKDFPGADFPKAYGIGPLTSGTSYDARARGPEGGMRSINKMPTVPSPLRRNGTSHADNNAVQASAVAPRNSAGSQFDTVSGQTTQPPRSGAFIHHNVIGEARGTASLPRNDSQIVSSQMTQSPGVASSLRGSGTSGATTIRAQGRSSVSLNNAHSHRPNPASRQTTQSQSSIVVSSYTNSTGAQVPTSASPDDARVREPDTTIRGATQPPRATSSLPHGGTPGSGNTGVHIQAPGSSLGVHSDELHCVPSRAMEIPPAPEHQNYDRTRPNPLKKDSITSDELLSKNTEISYGKQATERQPSIETSEQEQSGTPNDELQEVELDDLTTEDIIIAIMGPTGAGKSSFVAKATGGNGDEGVGHSLTSHTSEIKATRCMIGGSNVVLVDTPGFDDTKKSDLQILESISDWLSKTYKQGTLLSGILYFHRISDNRMAGTPLKNLRVFQKLCGSKAMSQVVLVTTMWDEVEEEVGNERLEELKGNYWRFMIVQGSSTYCYRNTVESSRQLLSQLVEGKRREVRLQKEIADKNLELRETDAGRELYSRLDQLAEKRAEILARIAAQKHLTGDQATADDLRKQYDSLKAELDQTLQQMEALRLTSMQRATAYVREKSARIRQTFKR